MSKESREIEKLNPDEEVGKKRKIVFWSLLATGIGAIIIVVVLLLVFLLPKEEKFEIDLGSNVSVEDGTLTGEGSYKKGDNVTIVAEDIEGYRFTGWSFNGNIISTEKEYTIVIGEDTEGEYTANYAKIYSVSTFDNDNYGSFIVAPTEAIAGETVTVRYEVNSENQDKYQLKRLYYVVAGDLQGTQTTIENNTFTMPEGNVTIYAEFNNLYNINLTTNIDEEVDLTGEGTYIENETVTITAPNVAGYRFRNWTYNGHIVTTHQEYTIANIASTTSGTYIANYDRLYSITTNSTNGTVTITDNKTEAIANESVSFTIEPSEYYRIASVSINGGAVEYTTDESTYSFNMPAGDVTISVTYDREYAITVDSNSSGYVQIEKQNAIAGESVEFTVSDRAGYRITDVKYNNTTLQSESNTYSFSMPAGNVTISVTYAIEYALTVDSNSSEYVQIEKQNAIAGESVEFTVLDRTDYRLIEVKVNNETVYAQEGTYSFNMPDEDVTISVTYDREYAITVDSNSSGYVQIDKQNAIAGESVEFTVLDRTDYRLIEVKVNNETVYAQEGTYSFNMPAEDVTISVTYDREYAITVDSNSSAYVQIEKQNAIAGESVEFTVSDRAGYRITEVKYNETTLQSESNTYSFSMPAEDVTIAVTYSELFDIEVSSDHGKVTIAENKTEAIENESVSFTIQPSENYRIASVSINGGAVEYTTDDSTYSFSMPAGIATISVTYDREYVITVDSNSSRYVQIEKQNAIAGESVEFTVSERTGYRITEVKYNETTLQSGSNTYSFNMPTEVVIISVSYDREYAITVDSNSSGYVQIEKQNAIAGESVEFTVSERTGYRITEVKYNDTTLQSESKTYSFNMPAEDVTISVTYAIEYAITVDSNSSGYVQIEKQNAIAGESVEFTVSDRAGYRITEAKYNNTTLQSELNTYSFNMPAEDVTISVTYAWEYAVAIDSSASGKVTGVNESTAINGEKIIVSANIQDSVEDNTVTLEGLYYIENGSEDRVPINQTDGQYSFTMPANNVTIYAESQTYRRLDDFTFSRNRIIDYTGSASQLTLPAYYDTVTVNSQYYTIEKDTGKQITSIGSDAFSDCTSLTSVTIPEGVTSIGNSAFSGCTSLTEITLPNSLTSIGSDAFSGCTSLTSVTIPEGVTSIGIGAFRGCSSLTEITLPNSLISIGGSAFQKCISLTSITIPEGVTSIESYAFSGCSNLTSITLPNSLTSIGRDAFSSCTSLTEITIPEGVTSIGSYAFYNCSNLTSITLPNSLTSIESGAFQICSRLTSITIPEGVTSIGDSAFNGCTSLTEITIKSGDIYSAAVGTDYNHAGALLQKATTVRVLTTIVNTYYNRYLENEENFSTSPDGEYTVFTKL